MVQRVKVQSGRVIYEAPPDSVGVPLDLAFDVNGQVNVTKELNVGNDPLADGSISTPANTDLNIEPGLNGNLNLISTGTGVITFNGIALPTGATAPGKYIGFSSLNTLAFLDSTLSPTVPGDNYSSSQLDLLYPNAVAGQQAQGPTTLYQKVSTGNWRRISALPYTPVNLAGDTMTGFLLLNADPTAALGAATKQYVDNVATGIVTKPAVLAATTTNLVSTYNNGASGVGATLTSTTNGVWPGIDTVTTGWAIGTGVLVKNQTNAAQNGRYFISNLGSAGTPWVLTRCTYCDTANEIPGAYVFVQDGTQANTGWVANVNDPPTFVVGVDAINWYQFSGAGTYVGGAGISVSSNTITNTGVLSAIGGTNISVSAATGNVTFSVTGTVASAFDLAGGLANQIPFQSAPSNTVFDAGLTFDAGTGTLTVGSASTGVISALPAQALEVSSDTSVTLKTTGSSRLSIGSTGAFTIGGSAGTSTQVLMSNGASSSPTWQNSTITIGSTSIALGSTVTSLTGLTSITATTFNGSFSGTVTNAANVTITDDNATNANEFITWSPNSSGDNGLRVSSTKLLFNPFTGLLTSTGFSGSGASLTNIPNGALVNSSLTINGTLISLGSSGTITAAAGTLTGAALNSSVTSSSLTSVGTLTSLAVSGNTTIDGNLRRGVASSVSAAGTNRAGATVLTEDIDVVTTVAAGSGVALPAEQPGLTIIVINVGANALNVYPNSLSAEIDSLGTGVAFSLPVGSRIMFICVSATQWYTLNATYA